MEIETKVISMETIKPSPPIPESLHKHQLSQIDQSMPPFFTPWIFLYQSNDPQIPNSQKSKQLKRSLSEVLSIFYPVAGRVVRNLYVDCNDGGAPFFEAEANCDLSQINPHHNHIVLNKLLPYKMEDPQPFCLAVQATFFRCGGVALGILISHKVADARSIFMFTNAWAAAAAVRNEDRGSAPLPKLNAAAYFPPRQDTSMLDLTCFIMKEEVATKIITFPAATISRLQDRYSGSGRRPSRMEALSAFLWTQLVHAGSDPNKPHVMTHMVDVRGRVDPPLSEHHFGNVVGFSTVMPAAKEGSDEVARKIRDAVKAVDRAYVATADMIETAVKAPMVAFSFSNLCKFPLYEADFGWGRPVWAGLARWAVKNAVYFTDTASGGGIEVLIHLTQKDMAKFEALHNLNSNL